MNCLACNIFRRNLLSFFKTSHCGQYSILKYIAIRKTNQSPSQKPQGIHLCVGHVKSDKGLLQQFATSCFWFCCCCVFYFHRCCCVIVVVSYFNFESVLAIERIKFNLLHNIKIINHNVPCIQCQFCIWMAVNANSQFGEIAVEKRYVGTYKSHIVSAACFQSVHWTTQSLWCHSIDSLGSVITHAGFTSIYAHHSRLYFLKDSVISIKRAWSNCHYHCVDEHALYLDRLLIAFEALFVRK